MLRFKQFLTKNYNTEDLFKMFQMSTLSKFIYWGFNLNKSDKN